MSSNGFNSFYATCMGCATLHEKAALNKQKLCLECAEREAERQESIVSRAEERSLGLAARKILSDMSKNKSEPQAPGVVDSFMRQLGGPEGFGEIIAEEIKKARGEIDPANAGHYKPSQHMTLKLLEMSSRIMLQNDDREETGFAHMSDEELLNTLRGLAVDLARNNPEFRRIIAIEAVRNQPDLIHELMNISGMPVVESAPESIEEDFRDAGLDEEDASVTNDD